MTSISMMCRHKPQAPVFIAAMIMIAVAVPASSIANGDTGTPETPLRIEKVLVAPVDTPVAGSELTLDMRVRNTSGKSTVRSGRTLVYLTRKATTSPFGGPDGEQKIPAIKRRRSKTVTAGMTLSDRARGRYRLVVCVDSSDFRRSCELVRGAIHVVG